ncbi:MAG: hypothetical protein ACLQIQ_17315 [Beijerinckiaceae bacterium]
MLIEWLQKPSTIFLGIYIAIAELLSCLPSYSFSCILISNENYGKVYSGNQACATLHEAVFRFLRFIWDHADRDNINAFAAVAVAVFTFTLWRSTKDLWKAGKEALETTERAYVFIGGFDTELSTAEDLNIPHEELPNWYKGKRELCICRFAVQPKWRNGGNTATPKIIARVHWGPADSKFLYKYPNPPQSLFIAPKSVETTEFIDMSASPRILVEFGFNPVGSEPLLLIWGRADYEDIFGHAHFIEWCYRLRMDRHDGKKLRAQFIQWGEHNRSD